MDKYLEKSSQVDFINRLSTLIGCLGYETRTPIDGGIHRMEVL